MYHSVALLIVSTFIVLGILVVLVLDPATGHSSEDLPVGRDEDAKVEVPNHKCHEEERKQVVKVSAVNDITATLQRSPTL